MSGKSTQPDQFDTFMGKLNQAIDVITEKTVDLAPEAYELILDLIRFTGVFDLVVGLGFLAAALFFIRRAISSAKLALDDSAPYADSEKHSCLSISFGMGGVLAAITSGHYLLTLAPWLKVFSPVAFVAYEALKQVGINL